MSMKGVIALRIKGLRRGGYKLRRLFLSISEFKALYLELAPIYQKKYGGMPIDQAARKDGYHNILFRGVAVCLKKENL